MRSVGQPTGLIPSDRSRPGTACNVHNYTIFVLENTLFAYYEYTGADHAADMARIAQDPVTREWWTHTDPCQTPFGRGAGPGETWRDMREVWHLE